PLREIVVGFGEQALRLARLFGGEYARAMRFQRLGRSARRGGGAIERPAEMLARMAATDAHTVMRDHLVVKRGGDGMLLCERRRVLAHAGLEEARDLAGKPRTALRAAPDHDGIGAGGVEGGERIVEGFDVAVDDDGHADGALDRAHRTP